MAGRGVNSVWRCSDCAVKSVARNAFQRRTFTVSVACQRRRSVPEFRSTSNPELNNVLNSFRDTVFVPVYLGKAHRDLVFGKRHEKTLRNDPVTVDIEGEEFALQHVDRTKDQPNTVQGIFQAIDLMKTREDWENLAPLLRGLRDANRNLDLIHMEKIVRKAGQAGRVYAIVECAKQANSTNFFLQDDKLVASIFWWIQYEAAVKGWGEKETARALKMAEQVAYLMEDERHLGGRSLDQSDARARPEVIGVLLQLAAIRASKHQGGKDADIKVTYYTQRLRATLQNGLIIEEEPNKHTRNHLLCRLAPIVQGLKIAQKVLHRSSVEGEWLRANDTGIPELAASEKELLLQEKPSDKELLGLWAYNTLIEA